MVPSGGSGSGRRGGGSSSSVVFTTAWHPARGPGSEPSVSVPAHTARDTASDRAGIPAQTRLVSMSLLVHEPPRGPVSGHPDMRGALTPTEREN